MLAPAARGLSAHVTMATPVRGATTAAFGPAQGRVLLRLAGSPAGRGAVVAPRGRRTISSGSSGRRTGSDSHSDAKASPSPSLLPIFFAGAAAGLLLLNREHKVYAEQVADASPGMGEISFTGKRNDQVKMSRDQPGVWIWGSNRFGIAAPDAPTESPIKVPRFLEFFDGWVLKDLALAERHAAAIDLNGDLYQWGTSTLASQASTEPASPALTVKGKKLQKLALAENKAFAIGADGSVYAISTAPPANSDAAAKNQSSGSWFSFFGGSAENSAFVAKLELPADAPRGERIVDIVAGLHFLVALSSSGRIYTVAADSHGNSAGQLGLNHLQPPVADASVPESDPRWKTRMEQVELFAPVLEIAAGDEHAVVRTKDGRAYSFGANHYGQLATFEFDETVQRVSYPHEITTVWNRTGSRAKPGKKRAVKVAAGGNNSVIVVEDLTGKLPSNEVFASGMGQWGQLGNGTYNHVQNFPAKIKPLSGLLEWDDETKAVKPIGFNSIAIGSTHIVAVMDNVYVDKSTNVEYGKDLMAWGMNTDFELNLSRDVKNSDGEIIGREKRRSNTSVPAYTDPLPYPGSDSKGRMQLAGKGPTTVRAGPGKGTTVAAEQMIVCGNCTTAVFTKVC
ncbi:regulator of chromosome condensation 1/beta-lactamase-inhibitor protein II [Hyaloraphidium curvatum]|nr:regulator of chromosome condensation 1/beta-lactamase-inhibitor protein II [Hyaloraphidium curvatum]